MADTAVEVNESPVVEKVAAEAVEEVEAVKKDDKKEAVVEASEPTSTENGTASADTSSSEAKENGEAAPAEAEAAAADKADEAVVDAPAAVAADTPAETEKAAAVVANGDDEANGDATDAAPAEAVKRKVTESEVKSDETTATPEKKAKLDEPTKDDVQNGAEASEVAA